MPSFDLSLFLFIGLDSFRNCLPWFLEFPGSINISILVMSYIIEPNIINPCHRLYLHQYLQINLLLQKPEHSESMDQEKEKSQALKIRKDKKKNTETGLLMGQNTNIFSQLSATYLQSKSSATQEQTNFANSTQIVQYHDQNINRLISLLRKKADVTKAKAATQLKQQIMKMSQQNMQEFIQTFSHLFMEIIINQQSKAVIDQFLSMMNFVLTNFKKILIKQIATVFGPLLVIHRSYNVSQNKIYAMLFNGTQQQLQQKAVILLLTKNVMKKFIVFCKVIIQCEEMHKIGQQNFQRNCAFLLKVLKQLIKNYESMSQNKKKQQTVANFNKFMQQINEIIYVDSKFIQEYFKVGGKAKSSFLQFYQLMLIAAAKHPQWKINWQSFAKAICQNYLDKDLTVQQSLWRYCNRQFIQTSLQLQRIAAEQKQQNNKQKQKFWILNKFLSKPDQKLLSAIKLGGQSLYKQLPNYCTIFPYTTFQSAQTHKSIVNKINFIRKLMQTILQQEDQNETRAQCYYQLSLYFIRRLRDITNLDIQANLIRQLDQKKQQQIKSLVSKTQKQILNNIQQKYYKNPPISRNYFTYYIPHLFCKLIRQLQPTFDFVFDEKQTFGLYSHLKNRNNDHSQQKQVQIKKEQSLQINSQSKQEQLSSQLKQEQTEYNRNLYMKIFQSCQNNQKLVLKYLQNFPSKSIPMDMTTNNKNIEQSSKIFLLSKESENEQNWFGQNWDVRKKLIVFDPRISASDIAHIQQVSVQKYKDIFHFKPNNRNEDSTRIFINPKHDRLRFRFFINCLKGMQEQQQLHICIFMLPLIKQVILQRSDESNIGCINQLLKIYQENVHKLNNKMWVVSQNQVLRLRILCQILIAGLIRNYNSNNSNASLNEQNKEKSTINKQQLECFFSYYIKFVLIIYNYKLESQVQELLKLLYRVIHMNIIISQISVPQTILSSVRQCIKSSYYTFAKSSGSVSKEKQIKQKESEQKQKQRKNRLTRLLNLVKKVLWYCVNKKKQQNYITLFQDVLKIPDWKHSQHRPDLWLICQCILEIIDDSTKRKIVMQVLHNYKQYSHFICLLMCYQLVLALQRYPSTKKYMNELQNQALKQIKQNFDNQARLSILSCIIDTSISQQSFLLVYGVKNFIRNLMKNYQNLQTQTLQKYSTCCLQQPLDYLKKSNQNSNKQNNSNKISLLLLNICSQLPLLDLPGIQKTYDQIMSIIQSQSQNGVKLLSYLAIIATMWQHSVGIEKTNNQVSQKIFSKFIESLKQTVGKKEQENQYSNFTRFYAFTFLNSYMQIKGKQQMLKHWEFILELIWQPVIQGTLLHGGLQSIKYKFISKVFGICSKQVQLKLVQKIPLQILDQVRFYKQTLDQMENQDKQTQQNQQQHEPSSKHNHYQNIVNMFIQFAEVLVRITTNLSKQVKPKQQVILEFLLCPFPGIKKTSFMLLKQMYQLHLVDKIPPPIFLNYLKIDPQIIKRELDPLLANTISGYLYTWQAIVQRRSAIQRPSTQQQANLTLQDYLQSNQLYEQFLKIVFEVFESQLQYTKNQQQFDISPEELMQGDTVVTIEDDLNIHNKIFRLTIKTLFMFIQNFPLFLRDFIDKNRKYRNICERMLRNVISDTIFKQQVNKIQIREHEWKSEGNFEIYVIQKNKQIYAEYQHDVIRIGLRLIMKSNYPLVPIVIQFGDGLKIQQGSKWALMLQTQLHSRNNTIINGILLWKENIDKKLAGVEQCAICYDIVNNSGQLPKKGCKTCKKKFHSVCIMKWFSKSNKSECPLCKSQFL